ncbi:MAG: RNA polymerase sigma factor [Vulcanimicrobiaceae bacterium]
MVSDNDETLAKGFARRERWAFDEAYRRYGSLLYSVAFNVLRNADDAQDCVHDVLVRIWKNPYAYNTERGAVRAFLVVCVRNDAISRQRTALRRAKLADRLLQETPVSEEFSIEDFVQNRRLHEALEQLPDEQRTPLLLAYFRGKTHVEIARDLDAPLGTIKSRISLGLRKLGNALIPKATR